jgi:DNA-binding NarL/FixJ family response regulator
MFADRRLVLATRADVRREGFRAILADAFPGLELLPVGTAKELETALAEAPDAALLECDGAVFDRRLVLRVTQGSGRPPWLVSAPLREAELLRALMRRGVHSILSPECSRREVVQATEAVLQGEKFYCHSVIETILPGGGEAVGEELSEREREVLIRLARGFSNAEVADALSLSLHTVRTHRRNLMRKIGARSITEVVRYAYDQGWIE